MALKLLDNNPDIQTNQKCDTYLDGKFVQTLKNAIRLIFFDFHLVFYIQPKTNSLDYTLLHWPNG